MTPITSWDEYWKQEKEWMQEYVRTPKIFVSLPSGAILSYHESNDRLYAWNKMMQEFMTTQHAKLNQK
jgi:hypothetical protein